MLRARLCCLRKTECLLFDRMKYRFARVLGWGAVPQYLLGVNVFGLYAAQMLFEGTQVGIMYASRSTSSHKFPFP